MSAHPEPMAGAQVLGRYPAQVPFAQAPAIIQHDAVFGRHMDSTVFTLGAHNVFNQKPPVLPDGIIKSDFNTQMAHSSIFA